MLRAWQLTITSLAMQLVAQGKTDDAIAAFGNAAKTDPTKAGVYYKMRAAVLYNARPDGWRTRCSQQGYCRRSEPGRCLFHQGSALVTKSAVDPKTNKLDSAGRMRGRV